MALTNADDGRHALGDDPLDRESMPYIVSLPDQGIATAIYTWVDKDNVAGSMFAVFGPGIGDEPIVETVGEIDVGPDANFDNWEVGPVRVEHALDLVNARVGGTADGITLDATYEAIHDAYPYSASPDGCPPFAATDRIEQSGRLKGTVTIDGKDVPFETTGARDHSWGVRDWDYAQHWKWVHASTEDTALHFWQIHAAGRIDLHGYVVRDGVLNEVAGVDVDFSLDDRCRQKTISARVTDVEGRVCELAGEYFAHFNMPPSPSCVLVEGGMRCTLDGVEGAGWSEFMWPSAYLEHLQEQTHTGRS